MTCLLLTGSLTEALSKYWSYMSNEILGCQLKALESISSSFARRAFVLDEPAKAIHLPLVSHACRERSLHSSQMTFSWWKAI